METKRRRKQVRGFFKFGLALWIITFDDVKDIVIRHLTKLKERFTVYFPVIDSHKISCVVDPFRCAIENVPDEPHGLVEAPLEL